MPVCVGVQPSGCFALALEGESAKAGGQGWSAACELKPWWLSPSGGRVSYSARTALFNVSRLGSGLGYERVLSDSNQLAKRNGVLRGQVGQHLAVERNFRGFQTFHEPAVSEPGGAGSGVDADLPERAEIPFFGLAIAIGILAPVIERVGRVAVKLGAAHAEAFGGADHSRAALAGGGGVGDAHGSVDG